MSEDNKKDDKFFQNNPISNPFAGPDDPLIDPYIRKIQEDRMEEIDKLIKEGKLGTISRVPPLFEIPLPEPDSLVQHIMPRCIVPEDHALANKVNILESEVSKLNSDIVHLKTVIFKLEMELKALKKNKEE